MKSVAETSLGAKPSFTQSWLQGFCRKKVFELLATLPSGQIRIVENGEAHSFGTRNDLFAELYVEDPAFYPAVALGGSIGAAEAYMAGHWHSGEVTQLIQIFARNRSFLQSMESGVGFFRRGLERIHHWINRNTLVNSRRNIAAHYDLGNDFFALFLDSTMCYSSALFAPGDDLEQASYRKIDRLCRKLALQPTDHLLEIGTGWGALAIWAAEHYGCRVTTTTISAEQFKQAKKRIEAKGLQDRIELRQQDYRHLDGTYDKLVSVEMIEAVGHEYFPTFFSTCARLLKDDGLMALQAITIADQTYEQACKEVDFIQKYIFPGGALPSVATIGAMLRDHTDLKLVHLEDITPHYAETLRHWREAFLNQLPAVKAMGFDDEFIQKWRYYFHYCEGGFHERVIGCVQGVFAKPRNRAASLLGDLGGTSC